MVFNPIVASGAAASFAALLSAILLAVLGNLALSSVDIYQKSLKVGAVALVMLLATTYMFVLTSGLVASQSLTSTSGTPLSAAEFTLGLGRGGAFLFAIAGSALAASALMTFLFLGLVVCENTHTALVRPVFHQTLMAAAGVVVMFLGFGYDDIAAAFTRSHLSWSLTALVVMAMLFWTFYFVGRKTAHSLWRQPLVATAVLALLPSISFRIATEFAYPYGTNPSIFWPCVGNLASAAWAGAVLGAIAGLSRRYVDPRPLPRSP